MKILHVKNTANLAGRLAQAQKQLGHEAVVWSRGDRYGFPYDRLMPSGLKWNLWMLKQLHELSTFDILHIHSGIWRGEAAYKVISLLTEMPIFIHYIGSDARPGGLYGGGLHWQSIADGMFYTDPDIIRYIPEDCTWIPQPIDLQEPPEPFHENERPLFVHIPSDRVMKGTGKIIEMFDAAFGPLQRMEETVAKGKKTLCIGRDAELWILEDIPYEHVKPLVTRADVLFDQISPLGIYGYASIEAMALGRPVLATVDRLLYPKDCPVMNPSVAKLMELARDESTRRIMGELSRRYVERVHAAPVVAQKTLDAYKAAIA